MVGREDVQRLALALPDATQSDHFGAPSFRVGKKIFGVLREEGRVTLKFDPEDQRNFMDLHPGIVERVTAKGGREAKAGLQGWTFVRYRLCDHAQMERFLRLAWSGVAPRRLGGAA